ncbi:MAG TPA: hypothetical protein VLX92_25605, partial [Kofleriaceae bacterium]|nr:hypothetical protein [Kofleriaceae bacterium]
YCSRPSPEHAGPPLYEQQLASSAHADAAPVAFGIDAAAEDLAPPDAAVVATVADAGVPKHPRDAAAIATADDGGVDHNAQARALYEQAHAALEDGDAARALELADASLKLRRTARTLLERARALQRLDRIDEALDSVDAAMALVKDYAPAYEQRALILWSAKRYDDAKEAMQMYLELDPNGRSAATFAHMMQEQH